MSSAEKLNVSWLDFFWNRPIYTYLWLLLLMWVMVNLLMAVEGRFIRPRYYGFAIGDSPIGLPVIGLAEAYALRQFQGTDRFYTQHWWYVVLLVAGVGGSVLLEMMAVKDGVFTLEQEMKPSKAWHTIFFGIMFALLAMGCIPLVAAGSTNQIGLAVAGLIVWLLFNGYDMFIRNPDSLKGAH